MVPVVCSKCGAHHAVEAYPSINTAQNPELKARVLDGSLFVWECPSCGARNLLRYETLYHDPAEKLMIWLLPGEKEPPRAVEEAVKDLPGYTLRRVGEVGELVEKAKIFTAGLDDWSMELCKWVTRREMDEKNPEMADAPLRFSRLEGADNVIIFALAHGGAMHELSVGFNVYEDACSILSRHRGQLPSEAFVQVNENTIGRLMR